MKNLTRCQSRGYPGGKLLFSVDKYPSRLAKKQKLIPCTMATSERKMKSILD